MIYLVHDFMINEFKDIASPYIGDNFGVCPFYLSFLFDIIINNNQQQYFKL